MGWDPWEEAKSFVGGVTEGAKDAVVDMIFLPYTATKAAVDMFAEAYGEPEIPTVPAAPESEPLVDPRKRGRAVDVIFAGRNYHWTGTVQPKLRGKGGE
jgi:hypothetical protein